MNNNEIRILIADDHPVVRAGLRAVVDAEPGMRVVAEVGSALDAVDRAVGGAARQHDDEPIDVVLLDLRFGPGQPGGVEATQQIVAAGPTAPRIVIVTTYDTDADILAALEAGATGYLLKDSPTDALLAAIRSAAAGESTLAPAVQARLMDRLRAPEASLTKRETEVMRLVASGMSNEEIARGLFLSQATVKSHLVHVFAKLGVDSRTAAVAALRERGSID